MLGKTILIVDDDSDTRVVLGAILRHAGFAVIEAEDGEDGLRQAREGGPHLVLMDLELPLLDGWEVTRRLKADHATAAIPVIALTARALDADRVRAIEAGCEQFLLKPCEPRDVLEIVRKRVAVPPDAST